MSEKNIEISMWYDRISDKNSDTHLLFGQKSYLSIFLVKYVGFEKKGGHGHVVLVHSYYWP